MSLMVILVFALVCIGLWFWTWGALMADSQCRFPTLASRDYRKDLAVTLLLSVIPTSWLITPFLTGFYEHGWTLTRQRK
jgi:hypothetical protein